MTCYEIGILLHYYVKCEDHPDIERNPPIWRPTIDNFISHNLLEHNTRAAAPGDVAPTYAVTERGRVFMEALQGVPLPIKKWVMP